VKPVDQRIFGAPRGDCWTACIASILEFPWEALEAARAAHEKSAVDWWGRDRDGSFDWAPVFAALNDLGVQPTWLVFEMGGGERWKPPRAPKGYAIASGKSPRGDFQHSVVALDGVIVHDPHPSRAGLDGPIVDWTVLVPVVAP
jgi:hypothetical protein